VLDYSFRMSAQPITLLLQEFAAGDRSALDRLMPQVYAEFHKLAGSQLNRERSSHTLQPTALGSPRPGCDGILIAGNNFQKRAAAFRI
jgi:hypothetical protein